jgi:catechol 2,3-dioxygenase-like lactoylglutathione lyase family enzyme
MSKRIDPRVRALGKARIDVTRRARDEKEWQQLWRAPRYPLPFHFSGWKASFQYHVDDFAAEIAFFIDMLGFPVSAFSPSQAQFTTPDEDFFFNVAAATPEAPATPPETLRLQFHVDDLEKLLRILQTRGVEFERLATQQAPTEAIQACLFTPHGVRIELWSQISQSMSATIDHTPAGVVLNANRAEIAIGDQGDVGQDEVEEPLPDNGSNRDHIDDFFQDNQENGVSHIPDHIEEPNDPVPVESPQTLEITYEDIVDEEQETLDLPVYAKNDAVASLPGIPPVPKPMPRSRVYTDHTRPVITTTKHPRPAAPFQSNRLDVDGPTTLVPSRRSNGAIQFPTSTPDETGG